MVSYIHFFVFIAIWPVSPIYICLAYDIESWFFRFLICGAFGPLAFLGSTLVTMIISSEDRREFKERWEMENQNTKSDHYK